MQKIKEQIVGLLSTSKVEGVDKLLTYLESSDFFTAPASTKFHLAEMGGLARHSLNVYELFNSKCQEFNLDTPPRTILIAGLFHDLCKVEHYGFREFKTKEGGTYCVRDECPWGHGEKSVFRLMKFIQPTDEEIALIRWHMGEPSGFYERMDYDAAREKYPSLTALICADLEASFIVEPRPKRQKEKGTSTPSPSSSDKELEAFL